MTPDPAPSPSLTAQLWGTLARVRRAVWPPLPWPPGRWLIVLGLALLAFPIGTVLLGLALAVTVLLQVRLLLWPPRPWPLGRFVVVALLIVGASPVAAFLLGVFLARTRAVPEEVLPFVFIGVILTVAVLTVSWVTRSVRRPLEALGRATERIAAGDLDFDLPAADVTEVQQLAQRFGAMRAGLEEAIVRQAELERQRREFVASISHDLRTPITSVRGYLEGMRDGVAQSPAQVGHYVQVALEKTAMLERLVSDLFDYTRLEYADQSPRPEPLEVGGFLQKVVAGFAPRAAGSHELTLSQGPAVSIAADPVLLERALANLLDNALRHTPAGGRVSVSWVPAGGGVTITVADSGEGIPDDDLPLIFEPLYRSEKSRSRRTGGAGLGLPIARRIARAHGGDLEAANAAAGGAHFMLTLPLTGPGSQESSDAVPNQA